MGCVGSVASNCFCGTEASRVTLGMFIARQVQGDRAGDRALAAQQSAQQQLAAARPSSHNLPPIVELPVESVLLVKPIAGYPCGNHYKWNLPGHSDYVGYSAEYKRSATADPVEMQFADVNVMLYANSDWALYAVKESIMTILNGQNPKGVTTVTKFGNKVIPDARMGYPDGVGELRYCWASGSQFVQVRFHVTEEDAFLKEYLALHSSTL